MQDDDPLKAYLRELANVPPLTKQEEAKLCRQLGDQDEQAELAARRLVESKLSFVVTIVERHSSSGIPILDLIQEGNNGLMIALTAFAERPIGDFSVHAAACIEDAISKAIAGSETK